MKIYVTVLYIHEGYTLESTGSVWPEPVTRVYDSIPLLFSELLRGTLESIIHDL